MNYQRNNVQRPVGVTIIAVLFFISGFFSFMQGTVILILGVEVLNVLGKISAIVDLRLGGGVLIAVAILSYGIAALQFSLGNGLIKLRNWARITVVVLSSIGAVVYLVCTILSISILSYTTIPFTVSLIVLILQVTVIVYLNLRDVRDCFISQADHKYNNQRYSEAESFNNAYPKPDHNFVHQNRPSLSVSGRNKRFTANLKQGNNVIGRSPECDIRLEDPEKYVSRQHALIRIESEGSLIKNLSHKNSIYVNNKQVTSSSLNNNDVIEIGKYKLTYCSGNRNR